MQKVFRVSKSVRKWSIRAEAEAAIHAGIEKSNAVSGLDHQDFISPTDEVADEVHPFCNRCTKAKLKCEGYETRFPIIVEDPYQRQDGPSSRGSSQDKVSIRKFIHHDSTSFEAWAHNNSVSIQVPNEFNVENLTSATIRSFLVDNLLSRDEMGKVQLLNLQQSPKIHDKALEALAERFYGQFHRQKNIISRSRRPYGEALGNLVEALASQELPSVSTVLSTVTLLHYEVSYHSIHCTQRSSAEPSLT